MFGFNKKQKNQKNFNPFSNKDKIQVKDKEGQTEQGKNNQIYPEPETKINLNRYKDPEGLTLKKLKFGLWFVKYRKKIIFGITIILIALSIGLWGYTLFGLGYYFIFGIKQDDNLIRLLTTQNNNIHTVVMRQAAKQPIVKLVKTISQGDNKYDFLAKIENPNKDYWAKFNYYFLVNGKKIGLNSGFIMPNQSQYFFALNQKIENNFSSKVSFHFTQISLSRISKHTYPNWENFKNSHFNIKINDKKFTPARLFALTEKVNLNNLKFNATNDTAYSYWGVNFKILLFRANNIVAINQIKIEKFFSEQTRSVNITWPGNLGQIDSIQIIPDIDIINPKSYITAGG